MSIWGGIPTLLRVIDHNRDNGRHFVYRREFNSEVFLRCYRQAHLEIFGMLETTALVKFLLLRLKDALHDAWMEDVPGLRRAVVDGPVEFAGLRVLVSELISIWKIVRQYVRYTGPRLVKSTVDRVSLVSFVLFCLGSRSIYSLYIDVHWSVEVPRCCNYVLGIDWFVFSELLNDLRLGMLLHLFDLC